MPTVSHASLTADADLHEPKGAAAASANTVYLADGAGSGSFQNPVTALNLYTKSNILGTVSQSSGVPTGAIVEETSITAGSFIRYADGTMMFYERFAFTDNLTTASGSLFTHASAIASRPTPAANFGGLPWTIVVTTKNLATAWATLESTTDSAYTVRAFSSVSTSTDFIVHVIGYGRWFA